MKKETANWDLEALIRSRAFVELTEAQQQWVLQQMSAEEYDEQRWILLASREFLAADPLPAPPSLDQTLRRRTSKGQSFGFFSWLPKLTAFQVPAWQLGMAILCGWLLGQWNAGEKNSSLGIVPQIVYQTDTIVREIPVYIDRGKQKLAAIADSQNQQSISPEQVRKQRVVSTEARSPNASIARDRDLLNFAVGMH